MTRDYVYLASGDVKDKHRRFNPMENLDRFFGKLLASGLEILMKLDNN